MKIDEVKEYLFFCETIEDLNLYINSMSKASREGELNFTFSERFEIDQAVKETEEILMNRLLH